MMRATPKRASRLSGVAVLLATARLRSRHGDRWFSLLTSIAFTVTTAILTLVASGAWMFYQRSTSPRGTLAAVLAVDPDASVLPRIYSGLTILACGLLIGPLAGLAASAAVLATRSRESRLASLRLMGLSSSEVSRMTVAETAIQAVLGAVAGLVATVGVLPLLTGLTFQTEPVVVSELVLPWWSYPLIVTVVVIVSVLASWWALHRVRISPLGVARRSQPSALRAWRLVLLILGCVVLIVASPTFGFSASQVRGYLIVTIVVLGLLGLADLALPYLLQLLATPLTSLPWPSVVWAARRIIADPRSAWRRISTLAVVAFVSGFIAVIPLTASRQADPNQQSLTDALHTDVNTGVALVISFSFTLATMASLLGQASASLERADQSRALAAIGAPWSFAVRTAWCEALIPLILTSLVCIGLGALIARLLATTLTASISADPNLIVYPNSPLAVYSLFAGLVLVAASLAVNLPLQKSIATSWQRTE